MNGNSGICGAMTGGEISEHPEAFRDHSRHVKGMRNPKMIIGDSAHAAYFKGSECFKIKLVMVAVGADYRLNGKAVRKAVTHNSMLVFASVNSAFACPPKLCSLCWKQLAIANLCCCLFDAGIFVCQHICAKTGSLLQYRVCWEQI